MLCLLRCHPAVSYKAPPKPDTYAPPPQYAHDGYEQQQQQYKPRGDSYGYGYQAPTQYEAEYYPPPPSKPQYGGYQQHPEYYNQPQQYYPAPKQHHDSYKAQDSYQPGHYKQPQESYYPAPKKQQESYTPDDYYKPNDSYYQQQKGYEAHDDGYYAATEQDSTCDPGHGGAGCELCPRGECRTLTVNKIFLPKGTSRGVMSMPHGCRAKRGSLNSAALYHWRTRHRL